MSRDSKTCSCNDERDACSDCVISDLTGTSSITMQPPSTWTVPTPRPCPSCGHCPTCGRGNQLPGQWWPIPYNPAAPYSPTITFMSPNNICSNN